MAKDRFLRRAASRASENPFFLAGDMEAFRIRRNMEEGDLARFLSCKSEALPKLGLCRRPNPDSVTFRSDVDRLSDAFGVKADRLVQLIRERDALDALGSFPFSVKEGAAEGLLMAARDVDTEEPNKSSGSTKRSDLADEEDP